MASQESRVDDKQEAGCDDARAAEQSVANDSGGDLDGLIAGKITALTRPDARDIAGGVSVDTHSVSTAVKDGDAHGTREDAGEATDDTSSDESVVSHFEEVDVDISDDALGEESLLKKDARHWDGVTNSVGVGGGNRQSVCDPTLHTTHQDAECEGCHKRHRAASDSEEDGAHSDATDDFVSVAGDEPEAPKPPAKCPENAAQNLAPTGEEDIKKDNFARAPQSVCNVEPKDGALAVVGGVSCAQEQDGPEDKSAKTVLTGSASEVALAAAAEDNAGKAPRGQPNGEPGGGTDDPAKVATYTDEQKRLDEAQKRTDQRQSKSRDGKLGAIKQRGIEVPRSRRRKRRVLQAMARLQELLHEVEQLGVEAAEAAVGAARPVPQEVATEEVETTEDTTGGHPAPVMEQRTASGRDGNEQKAEESPDARQVEEGDDGALQEASQEVPQGHPEVSGALVVYQGLMTEAQLPATSGALCVYRGDAEQTSNGDQCALAVYTGKPETGGNDGDADASQGRRETPSEAIRPVAVGVPREVRQASGTITGLGPCFAVEEVEQAPSRPLECEDEIGALTADDNPFTEAPMRMEAAVQRFAGERLAPPRFDALEYGVPELERGVAMPEEDTGMDIDPEDCAMVIDQPPVPLGHGFYGDAMECEPYSTQPVGGVPFEQATQPQVVNLFVTYINNGGRSEAREDAAAAEERERAFTRAPAHDFSVVEMSGGEESMWRGDFLPLQAPPSPGGMGEDVAPQEVLESRHETPEPPSPLEFWSASETSEEEADGPQDSPPSPLQMREAAEVIVISETPTQEVPLQRDSPGGVECEVAVIVSDSNSEGDPQEPIEPGDPPASQAIRMTREPEPEPLSEEQPALPTPEAPAPQEEDAAVDDPLAAVEDLFADDDDTSALETGSPSGSEDSASESEEGSPPGDAPQPEEENFVEEFIRWDAPQPPERDRTRYVRMAEHALSLPADYRSMTSKMQTLHRALRTIEKERDKSKWLNHAATTYETVANLHQRIPRGGWRAVARYMKEMYCLEDDIDDIIEAAKRYVFNARHKVRPEETTIVTQEEAALFARVAGRFRELLRVRLGEAGTVREKRNRRYTRATLDVFAVQTIDDVIKGYLDSNPVGDLDTIVKIYQTAQDCMDELCARPPKTNKWREDIVAAIAERTEACALLRKCRNKEHLKPEEVKIVYAEMRRHNRTADRIDYVDEVLTRITEECNLLQAKVDAADRKRRTRNANRMYELFTGRFFRELEEEQECDESALDAETMIEFWSTMWIDDKQNSPGNQGRRETLRDFIGDVADQYGPRDGIPVIEVEDDPRDGPPQEGPDGSNATNEVTGSRRARRRKRKPPASPGGPTELPPPPPGQDYLSERPPKSPVVGFMKFPEFEIMLRQIPNWKAPGPDGIFNYYLKWLKSLHQSLYKVIYSVVVDGKAQEDWFYHGITYLFPKTPVPDSPSQYRPITCMSNVYKLATRCVTRALQTEVEARGLLTPNQLGVARKIQGAKEHVLTNFTLNARHGNQLCATWIDVQKAYDSVDHGYLRSVLRHLNLPKWMTDFIESASSRWQIRVRWKGNDLMDKKIEKGILQGDSLSPLLFVLCMDPLSRLLSSKFDGIELHTMDGRVMSTNHLLYIDDLKLFAKDANTLRMMTEATEGFFTAIGMTINRNKSATNASECAHIAQMMQPSPAANAVPARVSSTGPEEEQRRTLDPSVPDAAAANRDASERASTANYYDGPATYKYLGVEEYADSSASDGWFTRLSNEVYKRVTRLLKSDLSGRNLFAAINQYALSVLNYYIGIVDWDTHHFKTIDIKVRTLLTAHGAHKLPANKQRLYLSRKEGGRGLHNVEFRAQAMLLRLWMTLEKDAPHSTRRAAIVEHLREKRTITSQILLHLQGLYGLEIESTTTPVEAAAKLRELQTGSLYTDIYEKTCHRVYFSNSSPDCIDWPESTMYARKGELSPSSEAVIAMTQDRNLPFHMPGIKHVRCGRKRLNADHIATQCPELRHVEYVNRHNKVCRIIAGIQLQEIGARRRRIGKDKINQHIAGKHGWLIFDKIIRTDDPLEHNRPDIIVGNRVKNTIIVIEVGITNQDDLVKRELEKKYKYEELKKQLRFRKFNEQTTIDIIPYVMSWDGLVTKYHAGYRRRLGISDGMQAYIQRTVIQTTAELILRELNYTPDIQGLSPERTDRILDGDRVPETEEEEITHEYLRAQALAMDEETRRGRVQRIHDEVERKKRSSWRNKEPPRRKPRDWAGALNRQSENGGPGTEASAENLKPKTASPKKSQVRRTSQRAAAARAKALQRTAAEGPADAQPRATTPPGTGTEPTPPPITGSSTSTGDTLRSNARAGGAKAPTAPSGTKGATPVRKRPPPPPRTGGYWSRGKWYPTPGPPPAARQPKANPSKQGNQPPAGKASAITTPAQAQKTAQAAKASGRPPGQTAIRKVNDRPTVERPPDPRRRPSATQPQGGRVTEGGPAPPTTGPATQVKGGPPCASAHNTTVGAAPTGARREGTAPAA